MLSIPLWIAIVASAWNFYGLQRDAKQTTVAQLEQPLAQVGRIADLSDEAEIAGR